MRDYLGRFLASMRPAFSRKATFFWFCVALMGLILRSDALGVTSIVRALLLPASAYLSLLNFFHSTAWTVEALMTRWRIWLSQENLAIRINGRAVLFGDHTKTPRDGRRMPGVQTLHQDSETASKPSFFRGHQWGAIALWIEAGRRRLACPLRLEIHDRLDGPDAQENSEDTLVTRLVAMARPWVETVGGASYLVLDAFFSTGSAFRAAAACAGGALRILTRAKSSYVAYEPRPRKRKREGVPDITYGKPIKLTNVFDRWSNRFETRKARVYGTSEMVRCLAVNLLWKPTQGFIRFIFVVSSRGPIVLMSDDLNLSPVDAIEMFSGRVSIETMFNMLKNLLGAMAYHFWSKYLTRASRRPKRNDTTRPVSSCPAKTRQTLVAMEKLVNLHAIALGLLQILPHHFSQEIWSQARCWMRTYASQTPSEFITRSALRSLLGPVTSDLGKSPTMKLIHRVVRMVKKTGVSTRER